MRPEDRLALRILHLDHDPAAVERVRGVLCADEIDAEVTRVETREAFEAALRDHPFDLILADYAGAGFDGPAAQALAATISPPTPFLFVSGTAGEETAVECMRAGAVDYVLKTRLARLPASIRRGLGEARARVERAQAEEALQRLNRELAAQGAERTARLTRATERLDVRERELRETEGRLTAILDHSPLSIELKDLQGRYLLANRHFLSIVQRDAESIAGRTVEDFVPPRLAAIYAANDRAVIERGEPLAFEEPHVVDGRLRVFASSRFLLRDPAGQPYAVCGISVDITDRRHAEEEARIAAREAGRANEAKNEFLSRMSHDLRTPLNAILGFAQLLEADRLPPEQADNVQQIIAGGRHLLDLINEVLDISRIESGHLSLSPEPVAVQDVVAHAVSLIGTLAERRGIRIEIGALEEGCHVRADRQRLRQILLNLLSNAVKYNRPNGSVTIDAVPAGSNRLRVRVADTGAGLTPAQIRLLFRPFERLGAEQLGVEGTGLGLALSKGLAEAMGGTLGVKAAPGQGSVFWVELATTSPPAAVAGTAAPRPARLAGRAAAGTIVYVEDNVSNVRLIERVLQGRPAVQLKVAPTGEAGLALVREQPPDLVLLDLHLPDMNGEDVLVGLVSDPETSRVPVVILSADATPRQIHRLTALGAAGYLTKPLDISGVLDAVDRYLAPDDVQS